jgi:hypothetical protein
MIMLYQNKQIKKKFNLIVVIRLFLSRNIFHLKMPISINNSIPLGLNRIRTQGRRKNIIDITQILINIRNKC